MFFWNPSLKWRLKNTWCFILERKSVLNNVEWHLHRFLSPEHKIDVAKLFKIKFWWCTVYQNCKIQYYKGEIVMIKHSKKFCMQGHFIGRFHFLYALLNCVTFMEIYFKYLWTIHCTHIYSAWEHLCVIFSPGLKYVKKKWRKKNLVVKKILSYKCVCY